ncbi:hypothetical protein [Vreelandella titanicae]|uniref:Uncharacterized protein n=1 Tax=Vreelandella titanicae TaxID=664683 RepID=A0AAP9T1M0_9GAMM|nr:hypothetical protein [Halomonas titanicae]QKS24621.1 hypothetical protein FX987_02403 [Halomonas titanicae]
MRNRVFINKPELPEIFMYDLQHQLNNFSHKSLRIISKEIDPINKFPVLIIDLHFIQRSIVISHYNSDFDLDIDIDYSSMICVDAAYYNDMTRDDYFYHNSDFIKDYLFNTLKTVNINSDYLKRLVLMFKDKMKTMTY